MASCSKDEGLNKPNSNASSSTLKTAIPTYSIVNNRFVFTNQTAFLNTLQYIFNNQSNQGLLSSIYLNTDFASMMQVYDYGMSIDDSLTFLTYVSNHQNSFKQIDCDSTIFYDLPCPSILAYILNPDGLVQIGSKIIRVTYDATLTIANGDTSKISLLFQPINQINDTAIQIENNVTDDGQFSYKTSYFGNKDRLVARLYKNHVGGADYWEARTTSQHKNFIGIWYQKNIANLKSWHNGGTIKLNNGNTVVLPPATIQKNNASDLWMTVYFTFSPVNLSQSSCLINHQGTRNGVIRQILNNEMFR